MFLVFNLIFLVVVWLCVGALVSYVLAQRSNCVLTDTQLQWRSLKGFVWALAVKSELFEELGVGRKDRRPGARRLLYKDEVVVWMFSPHDTSNPFSEELKDALIHLRGLRGKPGELAQQERERLAQLVIEMSQEPARLRQRPIDGYVAGMKPDYDELEARVREKMRRYEQAWQEVFTELQEGTDDQV